jgi:hypothetical protein
MKLILGNEKPDSAVLTILRERLKPGQTWFAYENHAMDSSSLGHLQFLCCGPGCTFCRPTAANAGFTSWNRLEIFVGRESRYGDRRDC